VSTQLAIGIFITLLCLVIQCGVIAAMMKEMYRMEQRQVSFERAKAAMSIMMVIMMIILVGNLMQIGLWALLFLFLDEFEDYKTAFYHSVVNFSTLGYGDLLLSKNWRLLGALEALNGTLMIGLSTGTLFAVLGDMMKKTWRHRDERFGQDGKHRGSSTHEDAG
jgi:hypothetical protein